MSGFNSSWFGSGVSGYSDAVINDIKDNLEIVKSDVESKLPYGTLYFNNAKLFGSNFTIPNFPFSICATVRVDSWEGSTQGIQTIFQFGNN